MAAVTRQRSVEPELHWTDHYAKYGFAIVPAVLDADYIDEAQSEVRRLVGNGLPFDQWTAENVPITSSSGRVDASESDDSTKSLTDEHRQHQPDRLGDSNYHGGILHWSSPGGDDTPVLNRVYDQPRVRAAIDEMFGSSDLFNDERNFSLFIKPYGSNATRALNPVGHVDFVKKPIPIFGSGTPFQVSLVDKEPLGGNISVWPGTHRLVQKCLIGNPDWQYPTNWEDIPTGAPFEFVPAAGDMMFIHHLVAHAGNTCCTRMPRVSLHCSAFQNEWVTEVDPAQPGLSPLLRGLAQNGRYKLPFNEEEKIRTYAATRSP
jgi:hypothetical protein